LNLAYHANAANFVLGRNTRARTQEIKNDFLVSFERGRYNLCRKMRFLGSYLSNHPGNLAEWAIHPGMLCYKLPDHVSFQEAALLEPLAVAMQAIRRGRVSFGDKVLIAGCGPVGILCMRAAKAAGAVCVAMTDINQERLDFGRKTGADIIANVSSLADAYLPSDFDVCIECTGVSASLNLCFSHCERGARIVLVGMGKLDTSLRPAQLNEFDILGVFRYRYIKFKKFIHYAFMSYILRYCNVYQQALDFVSTGKVKVVDLITHRFGLNNVNQAFTTARTNPKSVKVIINVSDPDDAELRFNVGDLVQANVGGQWTNGRIIKNWDEGRLNSNSTPNSHIK